MRGLLLGRFGHKVTSQSCDAVCYFSMCLAVLQGLAPSHLVEAFCLTMPRLAIVFLVLC